MTTLKEMRDQVIDDLDLAEEIFVDTTELNRWINEGIKVAESSIHGIYEDYFLVESDPITITYGTSVTDYPSDIYANKVRKIIYTDGLTGSTNSHEVRRVKSLLEATNRDLYEKSNTNNILEWVPTHDSTLGKKIRLFPEDGRTGFLIVWYIRNAKQLSLDADICDIDEFEHFVIQYCKTQAYIKDGDPRADDSKVLEEQLKTLMVSTLSSMVPDNNNEVLMDMSFYNDSAGSNEYFLT